MKAVPAVCTRRRYRTAERALRPPPAATAIGALKPVDGAAAADGAFLWVASVAMGAEGGELADDGEVDKDGVA